MVSFDREQVNEKIRNKQGDSSLRTFAKEIGVSAAYLSDVLRGNREVGPKILAILGLKRIRRVTVWYVRNGK